jgi:hypothetical protein
MSSGNSSRNIASRKIERLTSEVKVTVIRLSEAV